MRFNSTNIPSSCPSNFKAAFAELPLNPVSPRIDFATTSCNRSSIHLRVAEAEADAETERDGITSSKFLLGTRGLTAFAFVTAFLATLPSTPFTLSLSKGNGPTDLPFMVRQAHHEQPAQLLRQVPNAPLRFYNVWTASYPRLGQVNPPNLDSVGKPCLP
jgi:hypothetical protein